VGPQETPRAPLRQPLDGHSASRGSPLWTTGTSHHEGVKIGREKGVGIGSDLTAVQRRRLPRVFASVPRHGAPVRSVVRVSPACEARFAMPSSSVTDDIWY
jgi:hypothetical protein